MDRGQIAPSLQARAMQTWLVFHGGFEAEHRMIPVVRATARPTPTKRGPSSSMGRQARPSGRALGHKETQVWLLPSPLSYTRPYQGPTADLWLSKDPSFSFP